MRSLGQFCRQIVFASVLSLALACSTFAGEIQYPGITESSALTANGVIQFPGNAVDPVTEIALSLLQGASLLF